MIRYRHGRVISSRYDGVIGATATRALLLIIDGVHTVEETARRLDISKSTAWEALVVLRHFGLVTWDDNSKATIRPTCTPVEAQL